MDTAKIDLWHYENKWRSLGRKAVAGTDEAGRGPLAGPVVAAAVIFDFEADGSHPNSVIEGINDSKKLSPKKRELLFNEITENCLCYSIQEVGHEEIDKINILKASLLAMKKCVFSLSTKPDIVLIDGGFSFESDIDTETLVKGDSLSFSIAAASILAKVYRDRLMLEYDKTYPQYGFAAHKGYPTKRHYEALAEYGPCPIHRLSFRLM